MLEVLISLFILTSVFAFAVASLASLMKYQKNHKEHETTLDSLTYALRYFPLHQEDGTTIRSPDGVVSVSCSTTTNISDSQQKSLRFSRCTLKPIASNSLHTLSVRHYSQKTDDER